MAPTHPHSVFLYLYFEWIYNIVQKKCDTFSQVEHMHTKSIEIKKWKVVNASGILP